MDVNMIPKSAIDIFTSNGTVEGASFEIDKTKPDRNVSARNLLAASTSHRDDKKT